MTARLPEDDPACDPGYDREESECPACGGATVVPVTETLAEERARLAARIEAIDAELVVAGHRRWLFTEMEWADFCIDYARAVGYSVPVALRAELLAHVPERLRAALEAGFADRDGAT